MLPPAVDPLVDSIQLACSAWCFDTKDLTDTLSVGPADMHAIITRADPTGAGPDVVVSVDANVVRGPALSAVLLLLFQRNELARVI